MNALRVILLIECVNEKVKECILDTKTTHDWFRDRSTWIGFTLFCNIIYIIWVYNILLLLSQEKISY